MGQIEGLARFTGPITVVHFVVIGLVALFAIFVIVWGSRLRARRRAAEEELVEEGQGQYLDDPEPAMPITATAPSPPPLADAPVPATAPVEELPVADHLADEPIAAAAPLEASPATEVAPAADPAPVAPAPEPIEAPEPAAIEPEPVAALAPVPEPVAPEPIAELPPAPEPEPVPTAAGRDELTRMKGVGPRLAERLYSVGITSFAQIAALSPGEAAALDAKLGDFQGRLERDRWIEQAGYLASGDIAGYEAKFGKL